MTNVDEVVQQANDASSGGTVYRSDDANSTRPFQDYEDVYQFDLAGNRISKTTDLNSATAAVDQIFTYGFDANDRLKSEHSDLNADGVIDLIAQFDYGNDNTSTQQTSRRVTNAEGSQHSITTNIYDLQGRLASSVHENFESNGTTVNYRESTSFDYDHTGIRVASNNRLERLRPGSATM